MPTAPLKDEVTWLRSGHFPWPRAVYKTLGDSRTAVAQLIEQRFGVVLAVRTMRLYLKRWGFTPQKPLKKAYEQSPAAVKRWLAQDFPSIAARAKVEGAEIHWGDESGLRSDDVRGRSYPPRARPRWCGSITSVTACRSSAR